MRKVSKNKKAFTLVEVMLAVAIIALTAGIFFSLILVVMKSHVNVVTTNDCADYALLNARAFENSIINAKTAGSGSSNIQVVNNKLCKDGNPLFDLDQYKVEPGAKDKWLMTFNYELSENGVCNYTITLADQATYVEGLNNYTYKYEGSVYIPHCDCTEASGSTFSYSDYT
ncbi:MAG: prepilin-type N-terminal cleavage/methylation domain-containing protein [Clostridia bacterium]|nr:prepilin-type N-terminal cleavage/methylation domain-containing protein [Clostridia bacterium]